MPRRWMGRPGAWAGVVVVLILLAIVTFVAGIPYFVIGDAAKRPPIEQHLTKLALPPGTTLDMLERAEVAQVVDGNTFTAKLEDGRTLLIRYNGAVTPVAGDRCYREAADRNVMLLSGTVYLLKDQIVDDGVHLLRYVFMQDGTSLDATLVAEGFATAQTKPGYYKDQLTALENQARQDHRGCLWK